MRCHPPAVDLFNDTARATDNRLAAVRVGIGGWTHAPRRDNRWRNPAEAMALIGRLDGR
jgi:hypothetical protein